MYLVANIDEEICGKTKCTLCTQYCPEANTIQFDKPRNTAFVSVDRCKGCMPKRYLATSVDMQYESSNLLKEAKINLPQADALTK
jgi:pyruvate ferredoxin oxidoreductase delta subunit